MGLFDIFTNDTAQQAAQQQIQGLGHGYGLASGNISQGIDALKTNYSAALQPYLQNYGTAQGGVQQLGNVLGLNGQGGSDVALNALRNTPGYKFQQGTLDDTVNASAAANGTLASGNQLLALNKVNQGLADSTYNQYVSQLQPFLGASNAAAGGIAGVNTGLGNQTANQFNSLANLGWQYGTGVGNANANATLAQNQANQNQWNALTGLASTALMFSDERLKENVDPIGKLFDGTTVYRYNYLWDDVPRMGVMAQEVEQTRPDAVTEVGGFKAVDYSKATDLAASIARFVGDKAVNGDDRRGKTGSGYADALSRFLEAA